MTIEPECKQRCFLRVQLHPASLGTTADSAFGSSGSPASTAGPVPPLARFSPETSSSLLGAGATERRGAVRENVVSFTCPPPSLFSRPQCHVKLPKCRPGWGDPGTQKYPFSIKYAGSNINPPFGSGGNSKKGLQSQGGVLVAWDGTKKNG